VPQVSLKALNNLIGYPYTGEGCYWLRNVPPSIFDLIMASSNLASACNYMAIYVWALVIRVDLAQRCQKSNTAAKKLLFQSQVQFALIVSFMYMDTGYLEPILDLHPAQVR
jgi:hypothetical protein